MILDSGDEIYVWIGQEATDEEKEKGLQLAKVFYWKISLMNGVLKMDFI